MVHDETGSKGEKKACDNHSNLDVFKKEVKKKTFKKWF